MVSKQWKSQTASGFLGAGLAFLLSAILAGRFGTHNLSRTTWEWLYFMRLITPQDAFAGSFPDFITLLLGRLLYILSALCLLLAAVFYALARRKDQS